MLDRLNVKDEIKALLVQDNWTLEALATVDPSILEKYVGIGSVTAHKIVIQAQQLAVPKSYLPKPQFVLGKSARVQRIEDSQK